MAEFKLPVSTREKVSSKVLVRSRKEGKIPAILYGHGTEPQMLWVNALTFNKTYTAAGGSSIIGLTPESGKASNVIVQDIEHDPMTNRISHIDFYQVRMDEELETHVPLEFVNESPAVREMGGILVKTLEEILVSCLPKDLPHSIAVDLSVIKDFSTHIVVKDLKIPAGVKVLAEEETTIALVEAPRTEAQMEELNEKVEADVTKVEGVVKEEAGAEGAAEAKGGEEKK